MTQARERKTVKVIKAGGEFAEEIIGHWALWAKTMPSHDDLERLKGKIRERLVPKSRIEHLKMEIEALPIKTDTEDKTYRDWISRAEVMLLVMRLDAIHVIHREGED